MNITEFFKKLTRKVNRNELAAIRISLLIAALDGKVDENELKQFDLLARKCDGCTAEELDRTFTETVRGAGYLQLLARLVDNDALMQAFELEAEKLLPLIVDFGPAGLEEATALWKQMAGADGDYSPVERQAIECLELMIKSRCEALNNAFYQNFSGLGLVH